MKSKIVTGFLLIALSFFIKEEKSFAQGPFAEATLWKNSGDSVNGWIDKSKWAKPQFILQFKNAEVDLNTQTFSACDIHKVQLKTGESLITYCGEIDSAHRYEMGDSKERKIATTNATLFLQPLVQGNASLYYAVDQNNVNHFFISIKGSVPEELHHYQFIYREEGVNKGIYVTSGSHMLDERKYKQQMLLAFSDCRSVFEKMADSNVPFTKKGLMKWFVAYNACHASNSGPHESQQGVAK